MRRYCISNIFGDAEYVEELEDVSPVVARFLILSYEVIMKMYLFGIILSVINEVYEKRKEISEKLSRWKQDPVHAYAKWVKSKAYSSTRSIVKGVNTQFQMADISSQLAMESKETKHEQKISQQASNQVIETSIASLRRISRTQKRMSVSDALKVSLGGSENLADKWKVYTGPSSKRNLRRGDESSDMERMETKLDALTMLCQQLQETIKEQQRRDDGRGGGTRTRRQGEARQGDGDGGDRGSGGDGNGSSGGSRRVGEDGIISSSVVRLPSSLFIDGNTRAGGIAEEKGGRAEAKKEDTDTESNVGVSGADAKEEMGGQRRGGAGSRYSSLVVQVEQSPRRTSLSEEGIEV